MATIAKDNIIVEFIAKTQAFTKARKQAMAEADKDATKVAGRFSRIADIAGGFLSAQLIQGAISGLGQLGTKALELSKNYEQTLVSFELFTGSLENAEALVTKLDKFSLKTPFEPTEVNNAAKTLLGFGRSADIVIEDLELIGNAAAASGADLDNLALVFGQVAGAGKLQGQDALQLINAGIPVYQLLSESLGVSQAEVKKLQSEGKITFDTLREGFAKASEEGGKFAGALIKQSNTFGGLVSTAKGAFDALLRNAGDAFLPIIKEMLPPIIEGLFKIVDGVKAVGAPVAGLLLNAFRALGKAVQPVVDTVTSLFDRFSSGTPVLERASGLLTTIAQVTAVVSRVFSLAVNAITALFDALGGSGALDALLDDLAKIPAQIGGVIRVVETLPTAFIDAFKGGAQSVSDFVQDIASILNPRTIVGLIRGTTSIADVLAENERKRLAENREEYKGFGEAIADAYEVGYREISNIQVDLPEIATKKNLKAANDDGKKVGDEAGKGLSEGFAASSIAGIEESIGKIKKIIEELADPKGDGIETLKNSLDEIAKKEKELASIQDLIDRITGEKKVERAWEKTKNGHL